jgi:hypothetical protein
MLHSLTAKFTIDTLFSDVMDRIVNVRWSRHSLKGYTLLSGDRIYRLFIRMDISTLTCS